MQIIAALIQVYSAHGKQIKITYENLIDKGDKDFGKKDTVEMDDQETLDDLGRKIREQIDLGREIRSPDFDLKYGPNGKSIWESTRYYTLQKAGIDSNTEVVLKEDTDPKPISANYYQLEHRQKSPPPPPHL